MKSHSTSLPASGEDRRSAANAHASAQMRQAATDMPDERAASLMQLQHQERASNSSQAVQLKACADMMAGGSVDAPVQRVEDEELLQGDGLEHETDMMGAKALAPEAMVHRQLPEKACGGPQIQRMRAQQEAVNHRPQAPVQREVKLSEARWGPNQGRWITTLNSAISYLTQAEAQVAEDAILEAQARAREAAWKLAADQQAWHFADVNGRLTTHFNDGWGALYGITSYDTLRDYIEGAVPQDAESLGEKVIDLGTRLHNGEHVSRPCSIRYTVTGPIEVTAGPITREVFRREVYHCGPSN